MAPVRSQATDSVPLLHRLRMRQLPPHAKARLRYEPAASALLLLRDDDDDAPAAKRPADE